MSISTHKSKIKDQLRKLRETIARGPSPFRGMTEEQVIEKLRKNRAEIWEAKLASRS